MHTSDWRSLYAARRTTAAAAVALITSGSRITVGHAAGETTVLLEALKQRADTPGDDLTGIEIVHMIALGASWYCQPEYAGRFRHNSLFAGPGSRAAIAEGRADFTPCFFSEIPRLFRERLLPVDVAFIQVSPPDDDGFCSFGVSTDYNAAAAQAARLVIAEVNPRMPFTRPTTIHVSQLTAVVEIDRPLLAIPRPKIGPVEEQIGRHVATLVPDGANLQLGIGAIPDATLRFLGGKKDLGVHTEMFSDGVVDLVRAGVITNRYNNFAPGRLTATFLLGTPELYAFAHNNPLVNMLPVDVTNDPCVAGSVDHLTSINSAIQVDLMGQVCADAVGPRQYSGVGGQVDFVRAASRSQGGQSIIAMPATAKNGTITKIVLRLDEGSAVTTGRNDVHIVVTEFGIAHLRGRSLRQRALALIAIAHPDFHSILTAEATAAGLI